MAELEWLHEIDGACATDVGGAMGLFVKGHVSDDEFRAAVEHEDPAIWEDYAEGRTIERLWWRNVPYSLLEPDAEPCGGEESVIFDSAVEGDPGAYPVTVVYFW